MAAISGLVLVPINGAPTDERALDIAILMARRYHCLLTAVNVVEVPQQLPIDADMAEEVAHGEKVLAMAERCASQYGSRTVRASSTSRSSARST